MLEKKVTRKQFLMSIVSFAAVVVASKIPAITKKNTNKIDGDNNSYGNHSYGGKSNA